MLKNLKQSLGILKVFLITNLFFSELKENPQTHSDITGAANQLAHTRRWFQPDVDLRLEMRELFRCWFCICWCQLLKVTWQRDMTHTSFDFWLQMRELSRLIRCEKTKTEIEARSTLIANWWIMQLHWVWNYKTAAHYSLSLEYHWNYLWNYLWNYHWKCETTRPNKVMIELQNGKAVFFILQLIWKVIQPTFNIQTFNTTNAITIMSSG